MGFRAAVSRALETPLSDSRKVEDSLPVSIVSSKRRRWRRRGKMSVYWYSGFLGDTGLRGRAVC